jgi:DNA-binding NtrC family response regulator
VNPASGDLSDIYGRALASGLSLRELKRRIELECITRALADAGGNITRAAERLGMKRPRLSQLLKEHGIKEHGITRSEDGR